MIETIIFWIFVVAIAIVTSPVVLGILGLTFALIVAIAFYTSVFIVATAAILLAAIASPFIAVFEKIKARRK